MYSANDINAVHFTMIDSHRYGNIYEQMLKLRYKGFIQEEEYQDAHNYNGYEFDQYDTPNTHYVGITLKGQLIAMSRLNRVDHSIIYKSLDLTGDKKTITVSYMVKDQWGNKIPPKFLSLAHSTHELTRLYVDSSLNFLERSHIQNAIVVATYILSIKIHCEAWVYVTTPSIHNAAHKLGINVTNECNIIIDEKNVRLATVSVEMDSIDGILSNLYKRTQINLTPFVQNIL
ncbi:MAG: N-acyl-L-homoserine lactone synthetase [Candidatus Deianiraeaceae bacterium]|jgi:N-acyl-L-homoserine lactone synthetase